MRVDLHPDARDELLSAADWYDERRPGLGDELIDAVNRLLDRVGDRPRAYPLWPGVDVGRIRVHRAILDRFPYAIAFEIHPDHVLVLAIAHTKRLPLYWLTRAG